MEPEERIPLQEAVQRGIIPCSRCGATGAEVRKVGGKDHFLCPACHRKNRNWVWLLIGMAAVALALGTYRLVSTRGEGTPPPPPGGRDEAWMEETKQLMKMGRYREARDRLKGLLEPLPKHPKINLLMGQCLMGLRSYDQAVDHFRITLDNDPEARETVTPLLGLAYQRMGRAAEARPHLEQPCPVPSLDEVRRWSLVECYLDLERYDDAVRMLPADAKGETGLWVRHRALLYTGKNAEALALLDDARDSLPLRVTQMREEGDFAAARKMLDEALAKAEAASALWHRLKRAELALAVESNDLGRLETVAGELASAPDPNVQGEALFTRAIGHLLAGRKDAARAAAWEFLARTDKDFSPLRLERMMMRHLTGDLKDPEVEAEAKLVSRFHGNELYWYLAVATGNRAWAEKALESTPGRNYPYHSIRRILGK